MTTAGAPPARIRSAAARACGTVWATSQAGTGRPWATSSDLASASWIFTGGEGSSGGSGVGVGTAMVPRRMAARTDFGTNRDGRLAILDERGHVGRATAEGRDAAGTRGASATGRS